MLPNLFIAISAQCLDKQQATVQLCLRADGEQKVKPPLIFRGKGFVATEEKEKYDKRVDMYFQ